MFAFFIQDLYPDQLEIEDDSESDFEVDSNMSNGEAQELLQELR